MESGHSEHGSDVGHATPLCAHLEGDRGGRKNDRERGEWIGRRDGEREDSKT